MGVERRHCWLRGTIDDAIVESLWHCAVNNRGFSFLNTLEKEERSFRLGTIVLDMIAVVKAQGRTTRFVNRLFQMEALRIEPLLASLILVKLHKSSIQNSHHSHSSEQPPKLLEVAGIRFLYSHTQYRRLI